MKIRQISGIVPVAQCTSPLVLHILYELPVQRLNLTVDVLLSRGHLPGVLPTPLRELLLENVDLVLDILRIHLNEKGAWYDLAPESKDNP